MNRIIILIVIILTLESFLRLVDPYEGFKIVSDKLVNLEKPHDQYVCKNNTHVWGYRRSFVLIPIWFIIWFFIFPIPILFFIYIPLWYLGWHYDREWRNKCYNKFNYGYATNQEINNVLRQRYPNGIPSVSVWGRKELWPNNFYHKPERFKEGCCFLYKHQMNKLNRSPCVKDFEMNTRCDFYANHIYENGRWRSVDRSKGERSECDRVPDVRKICCHTCSL